MLATAAACNAPPAEPTVEQFRDLPADQVMYGMAFHSLTEGIRTATLHSDTAYMFADSSVMHLRSVNLDLYDATTGRQTAHLTSVAGVYDSETKAMTARGNVVLIVTKDGMRLETEELHYDPQAHRVWSDVYTKRTEGSRVFEALGGFDSDDEFNNIRMKGLRTSGGPPVEPGS
jgi:LPS export ABC transporter protein LptC